MTPHQMFLYSSSSSYFTTSSSINGGLTGIHNSFYMNSCNQVVYGQEGNIWLTVCYLQTNLPRPFWNGFFIVTAIYIERECFITHFIRLNAYIWMFSHHGFHFRPSSSRTSIVRKPGRWEGTKKSSSLHPAASRRDWHTLKSILVDIGTSHYSEREGETSFIWGRHVSYKTGAIRWDEQKDPSSSISMIKTTIALSLLIRTWASRRSVRCTVRQENQELIGELDMIG